MSLKCIFWTDKHRMRDSWHNSNMINKSFVSVHSLPDKVFWNQVPWDPLEGAGLASFYSFITHNYAETKITLNEPREHKNKSKTRGNEPVVLFHCSHFDLSRGTSVSNNSIMALFSGSHYCHNQADSRWRKDREEAAGWWRRGSGQKEELMLSLLGLSCPASCHHTALLCSPQVW